MTAPLWARLRRAIGLTTLMLFMPMAAYAVTVSSTHGNGEQHRVQSFSNGAKVYGSLKSTVGYAVYYQGKVALGGCNDVTTGRYTSNVTSRTDVSVGGDIATALGFCSFQGVHSKVCRDISAAPDSCGGWSSRY